MRQELFLFISLVVATTVLILWPHKVFVSAPEEYYLARSAHVNHARINKFIYNEPPWWSTDGRRILVYGKHVFNILGINWWGAQGPELVPWGTQNHTIDWHLNILYEYGFNAIRYALAIPTVLNASAQVEESCVYEPELCGKHPMEFLEVIIDKAGKLGMLVMLDLHTLGFYQPTGLWYTEEYPESRMLETWHTLMELFGHKWNLFAIDLKNEPHLNVTWGSGDRKTDWRLGAIRVIKHINQYHRDFKGLYLVEGPCCGLKRWFKTNMTYLQVKTGIPHVDNRVVYSGHHYRPDRIEKSKRINDADLVRGLDATYGQVVKQTGQPHVFGEWGDDWQNPRGRRWMKLFGDWMVKNCMNNFFYWSLQAGSFNQSLISMEDWETVDEAKVQFLQQLQPRPTVINKFGDQFVVIDKGEKCG